MREQAAVDPARHWHIWKMRQSFNLEGEGELDARVKVLRKVEADGCFTRPRVIYIITAVVGLLVGALAVAVMRPAFFAPDVPFSCDIPNCRKVRIPRDAREARDCSRAYCKECIAGYKEMSDGTSYCGPVCTIERCNYVRVPRDVEDCNDTSVECGECESGHIPSKDDRGLYCALDCSPIKHCLKVTVARGVTDCSSAGVECEECDRGVSPGAGYVALRDSQGPYCGLDCGHLGQHGDAIQFCDLAMVKRKAKDCKKAVCLKCDKDHQLKFDKKLGSVGTCEWKCTERQTRGGCEPTSCVDADNCTKCVTAWYSNKAGRCLKYKEPVKMQFYVYRAQKEMNYHPENVNMASAGGVMWYVHNEVVRMSCPRHYDITRIIRYKATVLNTDQVYYTKGGQFGKFVQFDLGQCTNPSAKECPKLWKAKGYHVGCQLSAVGSDGVPMYSSRYAAAYWYSFPGRCPSLPFNDPDKAACMIREKGGECPKPDGGGGPEMPTGAPDCTWHLEKAGEVTLDELTGIKNYEEFCRNGYKEYVNATDRGVGFSWWDDKYNSKRNDERLLLLLRAFMNKYPNDPFIADPKCDGFT